MFPNQLVKNFFDRFLNNKFKYAKFVYEVYLKYMTSPKPKEIEEVFLNNSEAVFSSMIHICTHKKKDFINTIREDLKKFKVTLTEEIYNQLLYFYAYSNRRVDIHTIKEILEEMKGNNIEISERISLVLSEISLKKKSFNVEITNTNIYENAKLLENTIKKLSLRGELRELSIQLDVLHNSEYLPHPSTFEMAITCFFKNNLFNRGFELFRMMKKYYFLFPDTSVCLGVLRHCPLERIDEFIDSFDNMNEISKRTDFYILMMNRYSEIGDWESVSFYFEEARIKNREQLSLYKSFFRHIFKFQNYNDYKALYQDMIDKYSPTTPDYGNYVWIDILYDNQERLKEIKEKKIRDWKEIVLKNYTFLSSIFISIGDLEKSLSYLNYLIENKINFVNSNYLYSLIKNFGLSENEKYLESLLNFLPNNFFVNNSSEFFCTLSVAYLRVGNLEKSLEYSSKFLDDKRLNFQKYKAEFLECLIQHYSQNNDVRIEEWKEFAQNSNLLTLSSNNSILAYYHQNSNLDQLFSFVDYCLNRMIPLDDTSFFYLFSSLSDSKESLVVRAFESYSRCGTSISPHNSSHPIFSVIQPLLDKFYEPIYDSLNNTSTPNPFLADDVFYLIKSIKMM